MSELRIVAWVVSESSLELHADLLEHKGATVRPVSDWDALSAALREEAPDVVLLGSSCGEAPADRRESLRECARDLTVVYDESLSPPDWAAAALPLPEPHRFSTLLALLEKAGIQAQSPREGRVASKGRDAGLRAIVHAARRLTELENDIPKLRSTALELALDVTRAGGAALLLRDEQRMSLVPIQRAGHWPPHLGGGDASAVLSRVAMRAMRTTDPEVAPLGADEGGGWVLSIPLLYRRVVHGVLVLHAAERSRFDARAEEAARLFAAQFVVNHDNAQEHHAREQLAVVDSLTGLWNRRYFDQQLDVEIQRSRRFDRSLALALMDVDRFKRVNDTLGYASGDRLVREVATLLRSCFRESDIVTRWGGDEFAILMPDTGSEEAGGTRPVTTVLERVRQTVQGHDFSERVPGLDFPVSCSAGFATFPADSRDARTLFERANGALKEAKTRGRNRVVPASSVSSLKPLP